MQSHTLAGPVRVTWGATPTRPRRPAVVSNITDEAFTLGRTCEGFIYERRSRKLSQRKKPLITSKLPDTHFVLGNTSSGSTHRRGKDSHVVAGPYRGLPTEQYRCHEMQLQCMEVDGQRVELGLSPALSSGAAMRVALVAIDMDKYGSPVHGRDEGDISPLTLTPAADTDMGQVDSPSPATAMCAALADLDGDARSDPFDDVRSTGLQPVAFGESALGNFIDDDLSPVMSPATAMRAALAHVDMDKYSDPAHTSYEGELPAMARCKETMDAAREDCTVGAPEKALSGPTASTKSFLDLSSPSFCSVYSQTSEEPLVSGKDCELLVEHFSMRGMHHRSESIGSQDYDVESLIIDTAAIAIPIKASSGKKSHSSLSMLQAGLVGRTRRVLSEALSPVLQAAIAVPILSSRPTALDVVGARSTVSKHASNAAILGYWARTADQGKKLIRRGVWSKLRGSAFCLLRWRLA